LEVQLVKSKNRKIHLNLVISKKQLESLQDSISFSAWQFEEGGAVPQSNIKFLNNLYDEIKNLTGVESEF
jgi:hypothetical protein